MRDTRSSCGSSLAIVVGVGALQLFVVGSGTAFFSSLSSLSCLSVGHAANRTRSHSRLCVNGCSVFSGETGSTYGRSFVGTCSA